MIIQINSECTWAGFFHVGLILFHMTNHEDDQYHANVRIDIESDSAYHEHGCETYTELESLLPVVPGTTTHKSETFGLLLSAISAILFSLMSALVKLAGSSFPTSQIVLIRSIIQFLCAFLALMILKKNPWGPINDRILLALRGFSGAVSLACYFYMLTHMKLGDGTTVFFVGPVFVIVAARVVLLEKMTWPDIACAVTCLIGIIFVSKPGFLAPNSDIPIFATMVTLFGAAITSVSYCLVRLIGSRAHFLHHVLYFGLLSTILASIYTYIEVRDPSLEYGPITHMHVVLLVSIGLTAFVGQCFLNAALMYAPAGPVSLMRNLDIVCAFLIGMFIFGETPEWTSIVGACLIGGATTTVGLFKWFNSS